LALIATSVIVHILSELGEPVMNATKDLGQQIEPTKSNLHALSHYQEDAGGLSLEKGFLAAEYGNSFEDKFDLLEYRFSSLERFSRGYSH